MTSSITAPPAYGARFGSNFDRAQLFAFIANAVDAGLPVPHQIAFQDEDTSPIVSLRFGDARTGSETAEEDAQRWAWFLSATGRSDWPDGGTWWTELRGWSCQISFRSKPDPVPAGVDGVHIGSRAS